VQFEVLQNIEQSDYYDKKIQEIESGFRDNESAIVAAFGDKSELFNSYCLCLENKHRLGTYPAPIDTICSYVIKRLTKLGCTRGARTAYRHIPQRFKNAEMSDLASIPNHDEGSLTNDSAFDLQNSVSAFLSLPKDVVSLATAPTEDIQENEEALGKLVKESKRRWQEYIDAMRQRGIARVGQKESDVEGTPRPYDPIHGYFYNQMVGLADDTANLSKSCRDISEKIEYYPPETQKEDRMLADGIASWRTLFQWVNEHLRPYADLKFSQSYPDWWQTELLNKDFGKHAAAVKSKVATLSGGYRGMTREQVGDKIPDLADKALNFKGLLEIANKAFTLMQTTMPAWRKRRLDPSVGTRKENVSPKLSESAFGSSKDT
jgi:hypothetical protein